MTLLGSGLDMRKNSQNFFKGKLDKNGISKNAVFIFSPYERLTRSYSGNLVKVQRTSDYTSKWFGYDGNGNLKTSELLVWVGVGNDGLVEEIVNQANSNYNITQSTISYKPKIVDNGILMSDGLLFDGANDLMICNNDGLGSSLSSLTLYSKFKNLLNENRRIFLKVHATGYSYGFSSRVNALWEVVNTNNDGYIGTNSSIPNELNQETRLMCNYNGATQERWKNDTKYSSSSGTNEIIYDTNQLRIASTGGSEYFSGYIKNIIFFNSILTSMINI